MKSVILSLFACLLMTSIVQAQPNGHRLDIQLNKNVLQPGDSLIVKVDYKDSSGRVINQSLATLELIIENEQGLRTQLRWPMINGQASGALYLPDSLARGKYTLLAGLQQRFFEVRGEIQDAKKIGSIQAMLLTKTGDWDEQEVRVSQNGTFSINNWLFEDNALMAFSDPGNTKRPLNIRISTLLDSTYKPLAVAGKVFYLGTPSSAMRLSLDQPVKAPEASFAGPGIELQAVVVTATAKSPAQQFNEEYVSGLFQSGNERLISIMEDPHAVAFPDIFSYLQGRVAGLQITPGGFNGGTARWRGSPVTFFINEIRVSAQEIANIPIPDIAIVKAYPPPFFGAPGGGGGGGLAIYTRRGGEVNYLPANRQVFKVRGYTPSATTLDMNKLNM
ncbi:hypothetical protein [Pedobacter sp. SYSU D00535]|uniref:hypothetical protein n=1 Tax=Pedobacter sp. SYSU D00535 TaxID=2810308 RepID=UPI001A96D38C|nr:hypothetical protein [Pedobacter sp. SYSU D00535]